MNRTIPPEPSRPLGAYKNRCVSIDDATDAIVREAGEGSRSRGIRELVRHWLRTHEAADLIRIWEEDKS